MKLRPHQSSKFNPINPLVEVTAEDAADGLYKVSKDVLEDE